MVVQDRKVKTRNKLFNSALELFNVKGIDATSTKEITEAAGVAEGTLYRHFKSKDELAWKLFEHHYGNIAISLLTARRQSSDFRETVEATVYAFCKLVDIAPGAFSYCMLSQHDFLDRVAQDEGNPVIVIQSFIEEAIAKKDIPEGDAELLSAISLGIVMQPATFKLYGRLEKTMLDYADDFVDAIWSVLVNREN